MLLHKKIDGQVSQAVLRQKRRP